MPMLIVYFSTNLQFLQSLCDSDNESLVSYKKSSWLWTFPQPACDFFGTALLD